MDSKSNGQQSTNIAIASNYQAVDCIIYKVIMNNFEQESAIKNWI